VQGKAFNWFTSLIYKNMDFNQNSHKNAIVRTTTSRLLCEQVQRMGADKTMHLSKEIRVKILRTVANFLTEGSQETR
jgi:hypothetical protein